MTAIRIIDDHLELNSIGSNTHAQIDTHIAAADNYVKRDGSLALTADWDIGNTRKILADEIRARYGDGLKLYDDDGNGIFVEDGGNVGIGTDNPAALLDIKGRASIFAIRMLNSTGSLRGGLYLTASQAGQLQLNDPSGNQDVLISTIGPTHFNGGNIGIGTTLPTAKLDINSDIFRVRTAKTPATAGAAGNTGDRAWDADYFYICVATNTWERTAHATWP